MADSQQLRERTLVVLKPDAVVRGLAGRIIQRFEDASLKIIGVKMRELAPALVIVQAGHDDIGVPPGTERRRVEQAIALIRAEAPRARIALLTVFPGRVRSPAAYRTDDAIVAAGRAADRDVIIMDPLAAGWTFPRSRDGLHPTAAGDAWIARRVAEILRGYGVQHGPAAARDAIVCDSGLLGSPRGHRADLTRAPSRL